jgi:hypothetical protein
MMARFRFPSWLGLTLSLLLIALFAAPARAQIAKQGTDVLSSLGFVHEKLSAAEEVEPLDSVRAVTDKSLQNGWEAFRIGAGPAAEWQASIDKRTGRVTFAEGGNIAWIPGHGNSMTLNDLGGLLKAKPAVDLAVMDTIARAYLPRVQSLLGVDPAQLVLNRARSGQPAGHIWFVDYDVVRDGLQVEGARVIFRVNNGNLIQYGSENLPVPDAKVPPTRLTRKQALAAVAAYISGFQAGDTFRDSGSLHLLPAAISNNRFAEGYEIGNGRGLVKVWQFVFHRDGAMGTWRARVDAATGEMVEFSDVNEYAQATGGTYLNSPATGPEVVRPMPFANLSSGGFANAAGLFTFPGGSINSTLAGQYVKITDTCGAISQASDGSGNFVFGTSTGTDCITPGHGGAGNTHSSREQFYQVNRIKEVVRGWLPTNTFVNGQLTVNVNLNQTCNAYWNGSTLNFFKSGGGCANTGQIAGVSLHEFGHGIDQNDGTGTATDGATGESYGDTTALIALHDSCLGEGFLSSNCAGYGDACTACTGVRDADFAKHASNSPATADNFIRVHCPAGGLGAGTGPCGKEVHCESYVPTETMWDLAARDLPSPGTGVAWTILDRLWYLSRNTATKSFACTTGSTYTSNGCSAGSLWKVFRAVDDDNGNLNDGTPHGGALFAAFNRHGIACTTDAGASTTFAGCTPPASPTLSVLAGDNSATASWSTVGTSTYDVFRNESGCNAGFTKIASGTSATSLASTDVANGLTYYYQVTAFPSGNEACASLPSTCIAVTPVSGPCIPPASAPASLTATAGSGSVALAWTAVTGASQYHVLRSTTSGGPYTQVGVATGTTFTDTGLSTGTYFYVVRAANSATCESGSSPQASASVTAAPDFSLAITPASVTVALLGSTANYTVNITRTGGFTGAVTLSVAGLPSGATATFTPNPATGASSALKVTVKIFPRGTFPLTVTGTSGTITHTAAATLIKN